MKKILLLALTTTVFFKTFSQTPDDIKNYIFTYQLLAEREMQRTGVPASITLAQGILESAAGTSDLTKSSNNHFGIKCKSDWTGNTVYHDDDERQECFRAYPNAEASFKDHSDFLRSRDNYAFLFQLDPTDYQGWAKGLKKAGYATEKDYPERLIELIVNNHLQDYTLVALQKNLQGAAPSVSYNSSESMDSTDVAKNENDDRVTVDYSQQQPTDADDDVHQTESDQPSVSYPEGVFSINQTKVIYAPGGTSLFALASNYNIEYSKLLEFNELDNKDILTESQLIFLERKQKKGASDFHFVKNNETIENIAQTEGVRLENLLAYNHLYKGEEPVSGEKIYLKNISPRIPKFFHSNKFSSESTSIK